jgi:hypothetical protein
MAWGMLSYHVALSGMLLWVTWRIFVAQRGRALEVAAIHERLHTGGQATQDRSTAAVAHSGLVPIYVAWTLLLAGCVLCAALIAASPVLAWQREHNGGVAIGPDGLQVLDHRGRARSIAWADIREGWHVYVGHKQRWGPRLWISVRNGKPVVIYWGLEHWQELVQALRDNCGLQPVRN